MNASNESSGTVRLPLLRETTKKSFWYRVPVYGILHEAFFDETPPAVADLKDVLNIVGLLGALLLSVAMSVPGSLSYDELHDTFERFDAYPYNSWDGNGRIPIQELMSMTTASVHCLANSVVVVVLILLILPFSNDYISTDERYMIWWGYVRWVVLWGLANLVAGSLCSFIAWNMLMKLKFPDYRIEDGDTDITVWDPTGDSSSLNFYRQMGNFYLLLPTVVMICVVGYGNTAVIKRETGRPDSSNEEEPAAGSSKVYPNPPDAQTGAKADPPPASVGAEESQVPPASIAGAEEVQEAAAPRAE